LIALGAIALLLWTEHRVVQSSRDAGPLKQSVLERALLPESILQTPPTWEGLDRWSDRIVLAQRWIRWVIPAVGIVFCLGGFLLMVTSAPGAASSALPDVPDA
jgi:hypothetical protein